MDTRADAGASPLRTLALVCGVALLAGALISGTWEITRDRIAANEHARLLASLSRVAGTAAESEMTAVEFELPATDDPHVEQIYAMYTGERFVAWVYVGVAPVGYNGPINMLVGIRSDGTIIAAHVLQHRETPGLGDAIETEKSDWITQFAGASAAAPQNWALGIDGGTFDAITGATITPRAVVAAISAVLDYHAANELALRAAIQVTSGEIQ